MGELISKGAHDRNEKSASKPRGGGVLPYKRLMGMSL